MNTFGNRSIVCSGRHKLFADLSVTWQWHCDLIGVADKTSAFEAGDRRRTGTLLQTMHAAALHDGGILHVAATPLVGLAQLQFLIRPTHMSTLRKRWDCCSDSRVNFLSFATSIIDVNVNCINTACICCMIVVSWMCIQSKPLIAWFQMWPAFFCFSVILEQR